MRKTQAEYNKVHNEKRRIMKLERSKRYEAVTRSISESLKDPNSPLLIENQMRPLTPGKRLEHGMSREEQQVREIEKKRHAAKKQRDEEKRKKRIHMVDRMKLDKIELEKQYIFRHN